MDKKKRIKELYMLIDCLNREHSSLLEISIGSMQVPGGDFQGAEIEFMAIDGYKSDDRKDLITADFLIMVTDHEECSIYGELIEGEIYVDGYPGEEDAMKLFGMSNESFVEQVVAISKLNKNFIADRKNELEGIERERAYYEGELVALREGIIELGVKGKNYRKEHIEKQEAIMEHAAIQLMENEFQDVYRAMDFDEKMKVKKLLQSICEEMDKDVDLNGRVNYKYKSYIDYKDFYKELFERSKKFMDVISYIVLKNK